MVPGSLVVTWSIAACSALISLVALARLGRDLGPDRDLDSCVSSFELRRDPCGVLRANGTSVPP